MTIFQKVRLIYDEHLFELRNENEKQFIEDMYNGLEGLPLDMNDEDITEYLTPHQIEWINDIATYVGITEST